MRVELAGYLRRVRNVHADPEQIAICSGFTQALALICRVLCTDGAFAVEDPGSPAAWSRINDAGIKCAPLPVDERGLSVEALAASDARLVLVTPAHQFPTGVTLAPERRTALLSWAAAGGLVLEDDYDAEFRYDRQPVGALQGLAARRKYRATRDALTAALTQHAPHLRVHGIAAGLHALITLPEGMDDRAVAEAARQRGLGVYPLSDYCLDARHSRGALVLGYGALSEPAVSAGVAQLVKVISELDSG